jgi:hypothetical protein
MVLSALVRSLVDGLLPETGENALVAWIRGLTQVWRVWSALSDSRKVVHPDEMPEGMRDDCGSARFVRADGL